MPAQIVMDEAMTAVLGVPVVANDGKPPSFSGHQINLDVPLGPIELNVGTYSIMVAVSNVATRKVLVRAQGLLPFRVFAECGYWAKLVRPALVGECDTG
jgi:hypothetical protein